MRIICSLPFPKNRMLSGLDIEEKDLFYIKSILNKFLPNVKCWAYGSRVTGKSKQYSDLDLVLFIDKNQENKIIELKEIFDESNLPFRVDILNWNSIPDSFKDSIKECYAEV